MTRELWTAVNLAVILWLGLRASREVLVQAAPPQQLQLHRANGTNNESTLSRDNVIVFFDHRVRYHTGEADNAYTEEDLAAMISVIGTRFNRILIDTAPKVDTASFNEKAPSRVWIPSVVAQHNLRNPPIEVIVSFEFNSDAMYGDYTNDPPASSFDVAKHMADLANQIYPDTVKTLMMTMYYTERLQYAEDSHDYTYWHYSTDWHDGGYHEVDYVKTLLHYAWPYNLGIFMDVHDCGRFRGEVPAPIKEILPYLALVAVFIDPTTFHHLTTLSAEETSKMFVAKFEDCEERLQAVHPGIRVVPSALWKNHHMTISDTVEEWQRMSAWAKDNKKDVIMYEAFDTPGGRDFYYWGHGWWRLKDRTTYAINETSFVEKIEDANSPLYNKHVYSTLDYMDFEDDTLPPPSPISPPSSTPVNCTNNSSLSYSIEAPQHTPPPSPLPASSSVASSPITTPTSNHSALYAVLILLAVISLVLVLTHIYLHVRLVSASQGSAVVGATGINNGSYRKGRQQDHPSTHHSFTNPGVLPLSSFAQPARYSTTDANDNHHEEDDDDGVASVGGSVMEMSESDTCPIVSVSYKKL